MDRVAVERQRAEAVGVREVVVVGDVVERGERELLEDSEGGVEPAVGADVPRVAAHPRVEVAIPGLALPEPDAAESLALAGFAGQLEADGAGLSSGGGEELQIGAGDHVLPGSRKGRHHTLSGRRRPGG